MEILVRQFTDPICTWCWGSEPVIRKLEFKIPNLTVDFIMGGLVHDIRDFGNPKAKIFQLNNTIHRHWLEAEEKHGMPVAKEGFDLFTEDNRSSFPQNMAYKAGELQDKDLAKKLLRRIREATAVENLRTNELDVLISLAGQVGLDQDRFKDDMVSGKAEYEFEKDRTITASYGVRGFPSYSIKAGDKEVLVKGFQVYEAFIIALEDHMDIKVEERHLEKSPQALKEFMGKYGKATPREISYIFDLDESQYDQIMGDLSKNGQIKVQDPWIINVE